MPLDRIETALDAIRRGQMIILVDDEDRENEGDLVIAAEHVTAESIRRAVMADTRSWSAKASSYTDGIDVPGRMSWN